MEKEKPAILNQDDSQNQSNKFKDVKLVSIVKKKNPQWNIHKLSLSP